MDYQIVKARKAASLAMRRANRDNKNSPEVWKKKQYQMREYRKMVNAKKASKQKKLDDDYSKYIEWAILATIGLAVLSVSHPQVSVLAVIFAILIVAAIMDTKIKANTQKQQKEADERMEKLVRLVQNEKKAGPAIEAKSSRKKVDSVCDLTIVKVAPPVEEFPYKQIQ